jgi:hypothetical protein
MHWSTSHNSQDVNNQSAQQRNGEIVADTYSGILLPLNKGDPNICNNMDKPGGYAESNKQIVCLNFLCPKKFGWGQI